MFTIKMTLAAVVLLAVAAVPAVFFRALGSTPARPTLVRTLARPVRAAPAPPPLRDAQPVNGLKLTLAAPPATTLLADASNATPVKLRLTFENVGRGEFKLDTSPGQLLHGLRLEVRGPRPGSVRFQPDKRDVHFNADDPGFYRPLEKGKGWTHTITFPTDRVGKGHYFLREPGDYRIRVGYSLPNLPDGPDAKGLWTGTVFSNEASLTVTPREGKQQPRRMDGR